MTKVLEIKIDGTDERTEIHLMNVGEMFPADFDYDKINGFGGSRHPLIAGHDFATGKKMKKPTASMVIRRFTPMGMTDREVEITDPHFWAWIARTINGANGEGVTAEVDPERVLSAEGRAASYAGRRAG